MANYIYSTDGINAQGGLRANLPEPLRDADKATRIAAGWYDYVSTAPEPTEGETVLCIGFTRLGDDFTGIYKVIPAPPEPVEPTRYDTLYLMRNLNARGKWSAVKALLAEADLLDTYYVATYIGDDDPMFAQFCGGVVQAGILTQAELDEVLAASVCDEQSQAATEAAP